MNSWLMVHEGFGRGPNFVECSSFALVRFFGGLGQITGGLRFTPDFHGILNRHPFPDVVHGCLLEGMALALEHRFEPFSQGRGSITQERVEKIEEIAARHGICLAPLYNADGPVEDGLHCQTEWSTG
jgi:hypothetical protein